MKQRINYFKMIIRSDSVIIEKDKENIYLSSKEIMYIQRKRIRNMMTQLKGSIKVYQKKEMLKET